MPDEIVEEPVVSADAPAPEAPQAASFHELKAALPDASAEFICKQLEIEATIDQAKDAYAETLKAALAAKDEEISRLRAQKPGVQPVSAQPDAGTEDIADPITRWNDSLLALVKQGVPKVRAITALAKEQPELHAAYIAAYNESRR